MSQSCSRCGEPVAQGLNVCANCGAAVSKRETTIRCRHCRRRSSSELTICPHCGRALEAWRPARPVAALLVLGVLAAWLLFGNGFATVGKVTSQAVALLPPPATAIPAPLAQSATIEVAEVIEVATETATVTIIQPTPTPAPPSPTPTETLNDTGEEAIIVAEAEESATPTVEEPAAAEEPVYIVKSGDTLGAIANSLGVSLDSLMSYNNITNPAALRVGQKIRIPPPTATPGPTATPEPTATATPTLEPSPTSTATTAPSATPTGRVSPTARAQATATATRTPTAAPTTAPTATKVAPDVYVVKPGDTLVGIAAQVGRSAEAIAIFNGITDPTSLRVNQQLRIPAANYTPPPPTATRTPVPKATATPTATPTTAISIAAPVLVGPGDNGAFVGGDTVIYLNWQNPGGLPAGAENVLNIGVLTGPNQIDWRFSEPLGSATDYQLPTWLHGQAPQEFGRVYVWYVQAALVNRDGGQASVITTVSPPSAQRRFNWN